MGRPSNAPVYLLRAMLLRVLFSMRSERQLREHIDCNRLFRWSVDLGMDDTMWNHGCFRRGVTVC